MIYVGSIVNITDNSNVKTAKCIKILTKRNFAKIGDKIVVSIKETLSFSKIHKGDIYRAIIVRTKKKITRIDGSIIDFFDNSIVLLDKEDNIVSTRIFGVIPREIKFFYKNLISLSKNII